MQKKCQIVLIKSENKGKFQDLVIDPRNKQLLIFEHQNCTEFANYLYILSNDEIKENDWCLVNWATDISGKDLFEIAQCNKIGKGGIHYFNEMSMCWGKHELKAKKIIASTNPKLNLPKLSEDFIKEYVKQYNLGNIITEINVEYMQVRTQGGKDNMSILEDANLPFPKACPVSLYDYIPVVNSDNEININLIQKELVIKFPCKGYFYNLDFTNSKRPGICEGIRHEITILNYNPENKICIIQFKDGSTNQVNINTVSFKL